MRSVAPVKNDTTATARVICDGLQFPEGPIAMPDGSVLVVEIRRATLTRITPDGATAIAADWGDPGAAGPNGAAIGPDGSVSAEPANLD